MPPKAKAQKPKESEAQAPPPPRTVNERSAQVFAHSHPFAAKLQQSGPSSLTPAERSAWVASHYVHGGAGPAAFSKKLGTKAQKDIWKAVNEASLPLRPVKKQTSWGRDRYGRNVGEYTLEEFAARADKQTRLTALLAASNRFGDRRARQRGDVGKSDAGAPGAAVTDEEVEEERGRRKDIAALKMELYGQRTGPYAMDPAWDDVIPMPIEEPEGALAAIAYPEDYAEAISYLRAVMTSKEYSPRCLRLTEHVISMNPAHYTVWLYRFSIVSALGLPIEDEIAWLNEVSLEHLKNYQIWHHRRLLMDYYYPTISSDPEKLAQLVRSERRFIASMFAEDAKNYHVWSYRQYLVPKLAMFGPEELESTEAFISEDVRNNSAWSHRFFVVFSDPAHATPESHSTEHDPKVPSGIIDREIQYAQDKTFLAPQNQSAWNYLKGVLVKGGRPLSSVEEFVTQFVKNLGVEESENVQSTHALDLLAEIYAEKNEDEKADLCLRRLGEKWDRIRTGYWEWRRATLKEKAASK